MNNDALCLHHHAFSDNDNWAAANRVWCAFFHLGVVPSRVAKADRDSDPFPPLTEDPAAVDSGGEA